MRTATSLLAAVSLVFVASAADAKPKKKKGKDVPPAGKVAAEAAPAKGPDPSREDLDRAIVLIKKEQYPDAAVALERYLASDGSSKDEASYHLGKALYRMGLYHSALSYFDRLLKEGPKSRFYKSALEWCLFISRKTKDQDRVNEIIARNAASEFPNDYRDEFYFRLARFHFIRAIAIETGAISGRLGETKVTESVTGGKSLTGDIFGEDGAEEVGAEGADGAADGEGPVKKKEGGGLSIGEDLFSDEPVKKEEPKKEEPKKEEIKKEEPKKSEGPAGDEVFALSAKEHLESAARFVIKVNAESDKWGAKAKFLEAVVLYKQGKPNEALESFKTVIRKTRTENGKGADLRELAFFQLARTHFGSQQPSFSIFYYNKIDRDSYAWLDALYEASWAEFRLGNYEKALGNLLTLHSPFFRDEYYPESLILKAVIYYENCRYVEAKEILAAFNKRYEPVLEELKRLTERDQAAEKYYEILANLRTGEETNKDETKAAIIGQILQLALKDEELKRLDGSYREVDEEIRSFASAGGGFPASPLASRLEEDLATVRIRLSQEAGHAVKRRLEQERENIRTLIEQSIRIGIETSRAEQERIESRLRDVQTNPASGSPEFIEWTDDEKIVWPFNGEYWRDELGTYQLTLANTCRRSS